MSLVVLKEQKITLSWIRGGGGMERETLKGNNLLHHLRADSFFEE